MWLGASDQDERGFDEPMILYLPFTRFRPVHVSQILVQYPTTRVNPIEYGVTWVAVLEGKSHTVLKLISKVGQGWRKIKTKTFN